MVFGSKPNIFIVQAYDYAPFYLPWSIFSSHPFPIGLQVFLLLGYFLHRLTILSSPSPVEDPTIDLAIVEDDDDVPTMEAIPKPVSMMPAVARNAYIYK